MERVTNTASIAVPVRECGRDRRKEKDVLEKCGIREDRLLLREDLQKQYDWGKAVMEELNRIQKECPDVHVIIGGTGDGETIRRLAEKLGEGTYLILSREWLEQMKGTAEAFEKGKAVLRKVLVSLTRLQDKASVCGAHIGEGGVQFFTAETPDENGSQYHKAKTNYSVAGLYARMAGAGSKMQVQSAMSEVRRSIGALKLSQSLGSREERRKAQASVNSLQKLLARGSRKIRRLSEEEQVRVRRKRAAALSKKKKELTLRLELQKMRNRRRAADRAAALEGCLDDMHLAYRFRKQESEEEYLGEADGIFGMAAGATENSGAAEGARTVDVAVSGTVSFEEILD